MPLLIRNSVYNLVGQALLIVISLAAVKVVFRDLGGDAIGIIFAASTVTTVLTAALDLGFSATVVRQVSSHMHDEPEYITKLLRTASLIYWLIYVLLAVATYALAPLFVSGWIHLQTMGAEMATQATRVLAIGSLLVLPRSLYTSTLRGLQRMLITNVLDVSVGTSQQIGTIILIGLGGNVVVVGYWFAICFVLGTIAYQVVVSRLVGVRALVPQFSLDVIRRNLHFSSNMMLVSMLAPIHAQADRLFASRFLPFDAFGYYALASRVVGSGTLPPVAVAQAALPSLAQLSRQSNRVDLMTRYWMLQDLLCFASVPIFAGVIFAVTPLLSFLLTPELASALFVPAALLAIGFYMNATVQIPYVFSLAVGKPQLTARLNLWALVTVLPITGVLVYDFGLVGAALSWIWYYLWTYAYWIPRVCRECLAIPTLRWYRHLAIVALTGVATYGVGFLLATHLGDGGAVSLSLGYGLASLAFVLCASFVVGAQMRTQVRSAIAFARATWAWPTR